MKMKLFLLLAMAMACVLVVPAHAQTETGYLQGPPLSGCSAPGGFGVNMVGVWYATHSTTTGKWSHAIYLDSPGWECVDFDEAATTWTVPCPNPNCSETVTTQPTIVVDVNSPHTVRSTEFLAVPFCY